MRELKSLMRGAETGEKGGYLGVRDGRVWCDRWSLMGLMESLAQEIESLA